MTTQPERPRCATVAQPTHCYILCWSHAELFFVGPFTCGEGESNPAAYMKAADWMRRRAKDDPYWCQLSFQVVSLSAVAAPPAGTVHSPRSLDYAAPWQAVTPSCPAPETTVLLGHPGYTPRVGKRATGSGSESLWFDNDGKVIPFRPTCYQAISHYRTVEVES
jgi:hypothetical protein